MATTNTRYVDPNAAAGGDGTTNGLSGGTCAYVSLNVWEAARQADLPTGDIIEKVICSSDDAGSTHLADTTAVTIDGWTTDATRYIQIEAASSHGGKWDATIYRMECVDVGNCIYNKEDFVRFLGLQLYNRKSSVSWTGGGLKIDSTAAGAVILIDKCISKTGTTDNPALEFANDTRGTFNIYNCLLYDNGNGYGEIFINSWHATMNIFNCTFQNATVGIYNYNNKATVYAKNCGFSSVTTALSGTVTETTNSTSTPTFVDAANDDFHLDDEDATWHSEGTDLSATFTDDIDGDTRSAWSIGMDDGAAAAAAFMYFGDRSGGLQNPFATGFTGGLR